MKMATIPPSILPLHHYQEQFEEAPKVACDKPAEFSPSIDQFPRVLETASAWKGTDLVESQYVFNLTEADKLELVHALASFKDLGLNGDAVMKESFPLPNLERTLRELSIELHNGKGFFILRGLGAMNLSVEDSTVVWLGICSYIAEKRLTQDDRGNMLVHITSQPRSEAEPTRHQHSRHSNNKIFFHADTTCDILAFQTRSTASHGGKVILSSSHTIYNELAATRPDVLEVLAKPNWPFSLPYLRYRAILFPDPTHTIMNFAPAALIGSIAHPRPSSVPTCTPSQLEALSVLQTLAEKYKVEFSTQEGDLHFVNNLALMHRRDGFVDQGLQKRHLVRLWLRNEELRWKLPYALEQEWNSEEIIVEEGRQLWHLQPMPDGFFPLRKFEN